jgi:TonB family protein
MNAYLSKNIQYPKDAMKEGVEGRVVVKFVVTATGQISDVQVVRGIYPSIDAEAVRVVKGMPAWKPGKQNGVPVAVYYNLPISFRLENNSPADKTAGDKK